MSDAAPGPSRRATLAWMASASAAGSFAGLRPASAAAIGAGWPGTAPPSVKAPGYGQDPDFAKKAAPWPLTLNSAERATVRVAADILLPPAAGQKAPSALDIDAFVDEWVSAPYPSQAADRSLIVPGLAWLNNEATARFRQDFARIDDAARRSIFDKIAFAGRVAPGYEKPAQFFASFRRVVVLGYYTTPQGVAEIGYAGNTPIQGLYPGPSPEALTHLQTQLSALGLKMPA